MVSGVAYPPWGCYTLAAASCKCSATPTYADDDYSSRYGEDDDSTSRMQRSRYDDADYPDDHDYGRHWDDDDDRAYKDYQDEDYYRADDDDYRRDDDDVGADTSAGQTDYNAEYYHGDAKAGEGEDEGQLQTGEQFMLGPHILVQPVTSISVQETQVYLPATAAEEQGVWYDLHTAAKYVSAPGARVATVPIHPDHVPAFLRGGAILPKRERPRRSSRATHADPFTLEVAPDVHGNAAGELFLDRYDGYDDASLTVRFSFSAGVLQCLAGSQAGAEPLVAARSTVERVRFLGQPAAREVVVRSASGETVSVLSWYDSEKSTLTVRQPKVAIGEEWSMELR